MSPIEASNPQFDFAQAPPGFFRDPATLSGSPPSSPTEQNPMLIHHLANVSRAKLNNLFRSRKDSGLLKHVLIHNLSRSYEELTPELVTEEREDGYDEIMLQRRTAEEMWLDACLQDLDDEDEDGEVDGHDDDLDDDDDDDDDDEAMYVADSSYGAAAHFYYATTSSEEDLMPALSPDMSPMDDSDLNLSGHTSPKEYGYYFGEEEEDDDRTSPPVLMDYAHDRSDFFDFAKREQASILQRRLAPVPTTGEAFQKMHFLQMQRERELDWAEVGTWYY